MDDESSRGNHGTYAPAWSEQPYGRQKCPLARQAIKYLVQDGRYDYIETGSLISIRQNTKGITIPSEEERIDMYPMDFEEFRWALDDTVSVSLIKTFYERKIPLGATHRAKMRDLRLYMLVGGMPQAVAKMRDLRLYMLVGGMPQAVNTYLDTNDLSKVDTVKRNIIQLYSDDFLKLDPTGIM